MENEKFHSESIEMTSLVLLSIFDVILMGIMYSFWPSITNRKIINPKLNSKKFISYIWFFSIVFCVYAGWDTDYAHYYEIFENLLSNPLSAIADNLEVIYIPIIDISFNNYSTFRLYIWGGAILLLIRLLKNLKLNNDITGLIFISFNLLYFSYARVSLAAIIYFYGLYLVLNRKFRYTLLGIILILLSIFFHKSMLFLIALSPLALTRISSSKIFYMLLFTPIIILAVKYFTLYFISSGNDSDTLKISSAANYVTNSSHSEGFIGMIIYIFEISTFLYGLAITWSNRLIYRNKNVIQGYWNITVGLLYIAIIASISGLGYITSRRILLLSYLSLFFVLSYVFSYNFRKKQFINFSLLAFTFSSLKIFYYLYVNKVSGY